MKLSIEAKVAAAVAFAFAALSVGAIAQEKGERRSGRVSPISVANSEISLAVQNASVEKTLLAQH